ncbi:WD G-beta repeat containing protein [Babesia ovis]|uniref:WD G-beta repeat containing protein n=1 Tax=Babesia ovis TaxID=5869 RepID=A0A9W5TEQ4_BABOV|nr:WD G-beta repeat containing protein [Babesia ovis]
MPMAHNALTLVTALSESRRFSSYISDTFRLLPRHHVIISQHEDCIFALPYPQSDNTERILLSDSFVQGEGKDVARDYFQRLSVADRSAVCLLDANEEDLYNEHTRGSQCIYVAGGIAAYALNQAGDTLAVALHSGLLCYYGITSQGRGVSLERKHEIKTNTKNVTQMCFDLTGAYLACGAVDGTVAVFHEGSPLKAFHQQEGQISILRFCPNSLNLLAGTQNGDIVMYCLNKKVPIARFQDHLSYVNDIAFLVAEDGTSAGFISCARDSYVCFWSLDLKKDEIKGARKTGNMLVRKPFKRLMQFESVVAVGIVTRGLHNKTKSPWTLFITTESGKMKLIDPVSEKVFLERTAAYGQGDEIRYVTMSKELNEIVVLGSAGTLGFYSVNLELRHHLLGNIDGAYQMICYQGNEVVDIGDLEQYLEASDNPVSTLEEKTNKNTKTSKKTSGNKRADIMDVDEPLDTIANSEQLDANAHQLLQKRDWIHSLDWLNKQVTKGVPVLFILCGDDAIRMVALDGWGSCITLGLANETHRHQDTVLSIAYSPSGSILVSGGKDEQVFVWDLKTLTVVTKVIIDGLNVACVAMPSGITSASSQFRLLATGENVLKSYDISLSWMTSTKSEPLLAMATRETHTISTATATAVKHKKPINAIAFSPNNKVIATAGSDKMVVIYSADNLIVKGECIGHRRSVVSVAFTRINKTVVSSSIDMTIKIWNLNDFSCIKTLQGHTKAVMKVSVLPNDLQLLSAGMDGLLKIWNIKTSDCIFTADNHSDKVWNAEVCGNSFLTISGNGVLISWDDTSAELEAKKLMDERDEELKRTQVESLDADGKYSEALCLAMELRKPHMATKILKRRCSTQLFRVEKEHQIRQDIFKSWVAHIKKLPDVKTMLTIALDFVQLWISKGSTSWMANCLLAELVTQFQPSELFVVEGMSNRIESILSHQTSHLTRFINLSEKSHLLDVLLGYKSQRDATGGSSLTYDVLYN